MKLRMLLSTALFLAGILFGLSLAQPAVYAAPATETPNPSPVGPSRIAVAMREAGRMASEAEIYGPAILGIMDKHNPSLDSWQRAEILQEILAAADRWQLDPLLIAAVIAAESGFDPIARSFVYVNVNGKKVRRECARGLMQLIKAHEWRCPDRFDIADNIDTGCWYLALQRSRFETDALTLSAYNAGPGQARWALYNHPETSAYVPRVLKIRQQLARAQTAGSMAERYRLASGLQEIPPEMYWGLTMARSRKGAGA